MLPQLYQRLGTYAPIMRKPRLEPAVVPQAPRSYAWRGIITAGMIPYGHTMVEFYYAPKPQFSARGQGSAYTQYQTNRVFVGEAPTRGVYTGVKYA